MFKKLFLVSCFILLAGCATQKPRTTLEKINNMTFPLTVENDTDATQFILAAAQGSNQIKNCHYNAQKNAALKKTVDTIKNIFTAPSQYSFTQQEIDLLVFKEAAAQQKTFTQAQCFDKNLTTEQAIKKQTAYQNAINGLSQNNKHAPF